MEVRFGLTNLRFTPTFKMPNKGFTPQYGKIIAITSEAYTGVTEVTPTENEQVLLTQNKRVPSNIIVHAIPSNWGKIIWDGVSLTVE